MQIIIVRQSRRGRHRLEFGLVARAIGLSLIVGAIGVAFVMGQYARHLDLPSLGALSAAFSAPAAASVPAATQYASSQAVDMHGELVEQRDVLRGALLRGEREVEALAARVAEVQAQVIRINALGQRLVEKAQLEPGEFDFSQPPPAGGPTPVEGALGGVNELSSALGQLRHLLDAREQMMTGIDSLLTDEELSEIRRPSGRPVEVAFISSGFGERLDPVTGKRSMHYGIDFAARRGERVQAVAAGVVSYAGVRTDYGNVVEIVHGDGLMTRYAHNRKNLVRVGKSVAKGATIAEVGSTGRATGAHVHFEVLRDGVQVDPLSYINRVESVDK